MASLKSKIEFHFGVSKGKRTLSRNQNLKAYCNQMVQSLLLKWGYIKTKSMKIKKLKDNLYQNCRRVTGPIW